MPQRAHAPDVPALDSLQDDHLLTQAQLSELTGFARITFRVWAAKGLGPKITRINGHLPRYRAADVRAWLRADHAEA